MDDYDDDGLDDDYDADDYGDAGGMTAEDEAAMAEGTVAVRKELGQEDSSKVTLKQIQDALWNYFYDVPKSVSYLRKTFIAPPPAKPTPKTGPQKKTAEGMSRDIPLPPTHSLLVGAIGADQQCSSTAEAAPDTRSLFPTGLDRHTTSPLGFFDDMPWLQTSQDRQTLFVEPPRLRGGLLGGGEGSGMSKLQKLAAARKKKADDSKQQEKTTQIETGVGHMSVSDSKEEADTKPVPFAKRQKLSPESTRPDPVQDLEENSPEETQQSAPSVPVKIHDDPGSQIGLSQAKPSAFARTLFGSAPGASRAREKDIFPMPSTQSSLFSAANFSQPSPDDVVFDAQSKGSGFAKAK